MTTAAIRTVDGIELPAPGLWRVDADHTDAAFIGRHLGLSRIRGRFTGVNGTVEIAEDITQSHIEILIDMASAESGSDDRDHSLRSQHWFDVANHPTAMFRSTGITTDGTHGTITGDLTIKDVTRPVTLAVEYVGHVRDPWGNHRTAFSATATIDRQHWNLTPPIPLDASRALVATKIRLEIETELILTR